ncbi:Ferredoxin-thioredoxin reductase catalytic chain, chloroplastic [Sesamum angolense]|uniref:Ferredoxin-thioredoxin reductase catalytic chain, chloroplastic n=1 Tax=Sesamum angolense TaxID=2727404 RepID=A0AAE2BPR2_9LAMI|nr:Ferredoxin-thioredoxin reductase catalytic chain, chloroplastic [Sesamum angolense]
MRALQASTSYSVSFAIPSVARPPPSAMELWLKGLAEHKDTLGAPLCPCRKECHCMLFLTPDNDFAGQEQNTHVRTLAFFIVVSLDAPSALQAISMEEIKETTANM